MQQDAPSSSPFDLNMTGDPLLALLTKQSPGWKVTFDQDQNVREPI